MDKKEFIERVGKVVQNNFEEYKILPSIVIAQAILESGWGKYAIENNIFGIKAGPSWNGKAIIRNTKEWDGRRYITKESRFRAYDSIEDSILDYLNLVGKSKRYEQVKEAKNYRDAARKLQESGYATDPEYSNKLINIIESNRLYEYDNIENQISPWAKEAWSWAIQKGITDGTNPKGHMTREQGVTMLHRLFKLLE